MHFITSLFPVWAILLSIIAYYHPSMFVPMKAAIIPLLAVIMFGMGMTLTANDFRRVLLRPKVIAIGALLQFSIMPLAAYCVSLLLGLPTALLVGMVLVGASSGGTASNVVCYLARGDVALSITLTTVSTLLAVVALPGLTWLYVGQSVPVPVLGMLMSVLKIVIAPVMAGIAINGLIGEKLKVIKPLFPLLSVLAIVLIIAIIVALNQPRLAEMGASVAVAVMLHNLVGLGCGYWLPRLLGYDRRTSRTLAIEVGMQNSGLSVALAVKYFSPLAALPGAIFSIWHNLSGSVLAGYWARQAK